MAGRDKPRLEDIGRDFAREAAHERREERQSWDATLFEEPLSFPITADHALSLADLGQAHFAAHVQNDQAHEAAWARHVEQHPVPERSYARELGEQLGEHAS